MTTFVLKRYDQPVADTPINNENNTESEPVKKEPVAQVTISAYDSVSKIVARALYKTMPNTVEIIEEDKTTSEATKEAIKVISAESVNTSPVESVNFVDFNKDVVVLSSGFTTEKDEWFLNTLGNRKTNVILSMESFITCVKTRLEIS